MVLPVETGKVVWVANRDKPLPSSDTPSGVFAIKMESSRYLMEMDQFTGVLISKHRTLFLQGEWDSGNLVLSDKITGDILWESFLNPPDTIIKICFSIITYIEINYKIII